MKRLPILLLFFLLLSGVGSAQLPTCTVSGTAFSVTGAVRAGVVIRVVKVEQAGQVIGGTTETTTAANGTWSITVPRSSTAYFCTPNESVFGITSSCTAATKKAIPNASSANFSALVTVVNSPTLGIVVKDEGTALANVISTINFVGPNVSVAESATGQATVTISGSGGSPAWGNITGNLVDQTDLQTALDAKQSLDSDLTTIAGLSPTNDDIIQRKAGAWTNRTVAQFKSDLGLATIATSGSASDLGSGTVPLARISGLTNTEIDNAAGIAYSKLNLTGAILDGDLAGSIANNKLANSGITIAGTATSLGGSITASTILDSIGSTRGSVLYRGASGWAILTPGTNGHYLQSQGSGADPQWAAVSGSGDVVGPSSSVDNEIPRFDSTTGKLIQGSGVTLSDLSSNAYTFLASTPTQGASAIAGSGINITASSAIAGSSNAGAAAGGSVNVTGGAAARLTSGNANGGDINLSGGAPIGTGTYGSIWIRKPAVAGQDLWAPLKMRAPQNESASRFISFYGSNDTTEQGFISTNAGNSGVIFSGTQGSFSSDARIAYATINGTFISSTNLSMGSGVLLGWTADFPYNSKDLILRRSAAANLSIEGASSAAGTLSSPAKTPAQITADQNNYAPGTGWFQRWSSDASRNVTGLVAGVDGQIIEIWNVGSNNIVLVNESASSTAANRFANSTGADLTLSAGKCAEGRYDNSSSRWRMRLCN